MYTITDYKARSKQIHIIKQIISVILYIIIIPILIINFTLIIKSFLYPNKIPDFFGYKNFIIISKSMEPTIKSGDAVFIKNVNENDIKINDIITFQGEGYINTHRVVGIYEENGQKYYRTKGDNNKNEDRDRITIDKIEGKYKFKINNFGVVNEILKSKITLLILVLIVFGNIYSNYIIKKKREIRRTKRKQYEKSLIN